METTEKLFEVVLAVELIRRMKVKACDIATACLIATDNIVFGNRSEDISRVEVLDTREIESVQEMEHAAV